MVARKHVFQRPILHPKKSPSRLCNSHRSFRQHVRYFSSASSETSGEGRFEKVEAIKMATVSGKIPTYRIARAVAFITLPESTVQMIVNGSLPKVASLTTLVAAVQLAGVNAAKRTSDLLPLCHPIPISVVDVRVSLNQSSNTFRIESEVVASSAVTGVEMEALVSASVASLTLYDIAKSAGSQNIIISQVKLLEKRGGKSDYTTV